jgi:Slime mold cyclic AMP receptor
MACNVYLTFFHKYDGEKLRAIEKYYLLACYGIPFLPAIIYVFITPPSGKHIYGDATLWCWVTKDFDYLRFATFYGLVW